MKQNQTEAKLRKILAAVDGSEGSMKAAKFAGRIAESSGAELTILHVITIPSAAFVGDVPIPLNEMEKDARQAAEKYIASAKNALKSKKIRLKAAVGERYDSPVRGITEYAEKHGIDMIVMGTRGIGGFRRLVLGSVASGVVHYAHCTVTVVR